jgi:uncharacterized protein YkuJ
MLGLDISEVVIETPYDIKSYKEGLDQGLRQTIVDVFARVSGGIEVAIEIQMGNLTAFDKRMLYGVSARYVAGLDSVLEVFGGVGDVGAGEGADSVVAVDPDDAAETKAPKPNYAKYQALHPAYGISVLTENYFKGDDDAYRSFVLYDREHASTYGHDGIDLIRLAFFEIAKKAPDSTGNLLYWRQFLKGEPLDSAAPDYVKQAALMVDRQNLTAEEVRMLTSQQLYQLDIEARLDYAHEEGKLEGERKGKLEEAHEVARKSFQEGLSFEVIQKITGLDSVSLKQLQEN